MFLSRSRLVYLFILFWVLVACAQRTPISPSPLPFEIKEQIDRDFLIIRDIELESYLRGLVLRLVGNYQSLVNVEIAAHQQSFARSFPGGIILLSTTLIQRCRSESELSFILAHELGHVILGHHSMAIEDSESKKLKEKELEADAFGAKALINSGYSINGAFSAIKGFNDVWNFYANQSDSGYPNPAERIAVLENQMADSQCILTGSCLINGIESSRDFLKFNQRLKRIIKESAVASN